MRPTPPPPADIALKTRSNCDDVYLCWRTKVGGTWDHPIPGCLGFLIERQRRVAHSNWGATEVLRNRVGFTTSVGVTAGETRASGVWPFQRYDWLDHGANSGQTVRYQVAAMGLPPGQMPGSGELRRIAESGWTDPISLSPSGTGSTKAFFNRGFVMSQYVSRLARMNGWSPRDIRHHITDLEEPLRRFLSGDLRLALLSLLDEAINDPSLSLHVALYELLDDELIARLAKLHGRAHVVLSNGSEKSGDKNHGARATLNGAGVNVHDRLLGSKGLGHNKFAVLVKTVGMVALKAWTGSANWSPTGLCTQTNNAILFGDRAVAQIFLDQWVRLAAARNEFTPALVAANAESPREAAGTAVWFSRVRNASAHNVGMGIDLQSLVDLVQKQAKKMILYVMFQPGEQPLQAILERADGLLVRGVVSTLSSAVEEKFTLAGLDSRSRTFQTALIQPEGVGGDFGTWIKEVTRSEFLFPNQNPGIGHAITHSKMIVIDPFDDDCVVVTGSHNFSRAASEENDENFVVVKGDRKLAEAYAVACLGTYQHYRWRAYLKETLDAGKQPWSKLSTSPDWQNARLTLAMKRQLELECPSPEA